MIPTPGKYFAIKNNTLITTNQKNKEAKLAELDEFFAREGFFTSAASTLFIKNWYTIKRRYEKKKYLLEKNRKTAKNHIDNIEYFISNRYERDLHTWFKDQSITGKKEEAYTIFQDAANGCFQGKLTFSPIRLYLNYFRLTQLPNCLGTISQIQEIHLSNNRLRQLPDNIVDLCDLTLLNVSHNQLGKLPENIGRLEWLRSLNLKENCLENLPASFKELRSVCSLDLGDNPELKFSQDAFTNFETLQKLFLSNTSLKKIPEGIQFSNLKELYLNENQLTEFPDFPENNQLTILNLDDNSIEKIPKEIARLVKLTHLYLSRNKIRKISEKIGCCTSFRHLSISGNTHLKDLPQSLSHLQLWTIYFENTQISQEFIQSILRT